MPSARWKCEARSPVRKPEASGSPIRQTPLRGSRRDDRNPGSGMKYLPRVLVYLKPHWRLGVFSVVLIVLGSLAGLLTPWPMKILIDSAIGKVPLSGPLAPALKPIAGNHFGLLMFAVLAGLACTALQNAMSVL